MTQLLAPPLSHKNWLEISRGKSKFRSRPVHEGRFLIGAGSTCHLQLGGDQVPMLHSVIESNDDGLSIEAIVAQPPLMINGRQRRSAHLSAGDVIEIGAFEFVVHSEANAGADEPGAASVETEIDPGLSETEDLSQLSASELVDRISELEDFAADLHDEREQGALNLLRAIRQAGNGDAHGEHDTRYDGVVKTLSMLADQVVAQAAQFAEREQAWQQALFSVQDTQQRIILQLAQLAQAVQQPPQAVGTRASA